MLDLAEGYEKGLGVDVHWNIAASIYRMGTEISINPWRRLVIQPYYGLCLILDRAVSKNVRQGWSKIHESDQLGQGTVWFIQGECYRYGYGVKKDLAKVFFCYKQAIRPKSLLAGKLRAYYALGCMHESGEGVQPNPSVAFEHFDFSASRMHQNAQCKIAVYCESGKGVQLDRV